MILVVPPFTTHSFGGGGCWQKRHSHSHSKEQHRVLATDRLDSKPSGSKPQLPTTATKPTHTSTLPLHTRTGKCWQVLLHTSAFPQ